MKTALVAVALACLAPGLGFAATLTGSNVVSSASVNLSTVGTLDWARWPGYTHKGTAISDVTTTGWLKSYASDARLIGDYSGIKTGGVGSSFTFTLAATTVERTLTYYIGGWNSTGKVTVTLPGATTYTTTFSSSATYSRVITVKFRADAATTARVTYAQTAGTGTISMQAAALSQAVVVQPADTAILTWKPPASNEDGSALADLAAFKVYWGTAPGAYSQSTKISSATARSYTVTGLTKGTWYFVVTALNSKGVESPYSNVWSKTVP
jgi:fibronectin type III domain protein